MLPLPDLDPSELQRYSRHLLLPDVGEAGQRRLKQARVLLVGAGGLGSPAALYLAAAGVGTLGIADADRVEPSNLQRQLLHGTEDVGRLKVDSARDRVAAVNPLVRVETHPVRVTSANALELLRAYDIVVDGTDNFQTRYLTNDACVLLGKPNVYGSVFRFEGQAAVFAVPGGPCYRCLFREPPPAGVVPTCEEAGVLGVLPGLVGMIQATETIKLILGLGDTLSGRLLLVDALRMRFRTIEVRPDPTCPACGTREIRELQDYDAFCGVSSTAVADVASAEATRAQPEPVAGPDLGAEVEGVVELAPAELAAWLAREDAPALLDVREPYEHRIAHLEGAELVPLAEVPGAAGRLDRERDLVVYCHHGVRSRAAADYLHRQGFRRVWNLSGGIDRWSREVDPTVARY
jgi:molybdopterin/thiamine biosynthesis adenylyltransferase/rhodanese-related sulfurtransferase